MAEWGNTTFIIENNKNLCSVGFIMKKEVDMSEVGRGLVRMEPGLTKKPVKPSQALPLWIQTTQKIACLRVSWGDGSVVSACLASLGTCVS